MIRDMCRRISTMKIFTATGICLALLLSGCTCARDSTEPALGKENRLAVHLASVDQDDSFSLQKVGAEGELLFLAPLPLITDVDVHHASVATAAGGKPAVLLELTDGGAEVLRRQSDVYVGRNLAFLWDGRVVYAPRVISPLASKLMIVGGTDATPAELLEGIVGGLNVAASGRGEE